MTNPFTELNNLQRGHKIQRWVHINAAVTFVLCSFSHFEVFHPVELDNLLGTGTQVLLLGQTMACKLLSFLLRTHTENLSNPGIWTMLISKLAPLRLQGTGQLSVQECVAGRDLCGGEGPAAAGCLWGLCFLMGFFLGCRYVARDRNCCMGKWLWVCTSRLRGRALQWDSWYNGQIVRNEQSEGVCIIMVSQTSGPKVLLIRITYNISCLQVTSAMPASCSPALVLVLGRGKSYFPACTFPVWSLS